MAGHEVISVSINSYLIDKIPPSNPDSNAHGFEPKSLSIDELEASVRQGKAFSYLFHDQHRASKNFVKAELLAADFDGGVTLDEALEIDEVRQYASLIYTTPSHTEETHRFRVLFILDEAIEDPNMLRFAASALAHRLGSDPKVTDAARMFYGSRNCWSKKLGSTLPVGVLSELIAEGRNIYNKPSRRVAGETENADSTALNDLDIVGADGNRSTIGEIQNKQSIYCPFHNDHSPSAFVGVNHNGKYLHCSTCQKTWWAEGFGQTSYDFASFEKAVKQIADTEISKPLDELVGLEKFMSPQDIKPENIIIQNQQYFDGPQFQSDHVPKGLTFIKSPKGSGKTSFLANLLRPTSNTHNDSSERSGAAAYNSEHYESKQKVLLIGHRQSLIGELCKRLSLNCYLDDQAGKGPNNIAGRKRRYGICLDSLKRISGMQYDIVVIDEVEQVLGHFLSKTLGRKRNEIFRIFFDLIRSAKHVVALDADLGWATFDTLQTIKTMPIGYGLQSPTKEDAQHVRIILNEFRQHGREIELYADKNHLIQEIKSNVLAGNRIYISSNSKTVIESLVKSLEQISHAEGSEEISCMWVTSSNSNSEDRQKFIQNIRSEILQYQVILSSPSLGTGIDISFENAEQHIDLVVGIFEAGITNHFDIDQQLGRVRNPKAIKVWISPQRFSLATNFEIIVQDLLYEGLTSAVHYGMTIQDVDHLAKSDPFLKMAAHLTCIDRASKNKLRENFEAHKIDQGFRISKVEKNAEQSAAGKQILQIGNQLSKKEKIQNTLSAKILNQIQFEKIKLRQRQNEAISQTEWFDYTRTSFELFYRTDIDEELLQLDLFKHFKSKVLMFEALEEVANGDTTYRNMIEKHDQKNLQRLQVELIEDRAIAAGLLHELLLPTPIYLGSSGFQTNLKYSVKELDQFANRVKSLGKMSQTQLNLAARKDIAQKPTQYLSQLLGRVGLSQNPAGSKKVNGQKIRYYELDSSSLEAMKNIAKRRAHEPAWANVNNRYGFTYTEEENDWLYQYT